MNFVPHEIPTSSIDTTLSTKLTIVCWKWRGWRGDSFYKPEHVNTLNYMLNKHLRIPYRLVCVTDDPAGINCETVPLWDQKVDLGLGKGAPDCYRRVKIFSTEARDLLGERVLSVDLDTIILDDITSLLHTSSTFKALRGKAAPINGSLMLVSPGEHPEVWDDFNKHSPGVVLRYQRLSDIRHYGSDQAWISYKLRNPPMWGERDGLYQYTTLKGPVPDNARMIFFAGSNKPWGRQLQEKYPELHEIYAQAYRSVT